MGAYLSEPMTAKQSEDGEGNKIQFGACSMQGWRVSQEDAHNCIAAFDENSSLFAVYDGHGGAEVAIYLSRHLPDVLKNCSAYKEGEFVKALEECFLKIDESIKTPEVIREIQQLAKHNQSDNEAAVDYEDENVGALYEEATMPLEKLVAKYQSTCEESSENKEDEDCKPGSSRSITFVAGSSTAGSSRSTSAEACQSSSSSLTSPSSSACAGPSGSSPSSSACVKVNGQSEDASTVGSSTDQPKRSEPASASDNTIKTDDEKNGPSSSTDEGNELIVEGKKIELLQTKNSDEVDSSEAVHAVISEDSQLKEAKKKSVNGETSSGEQQDGVSAVDNSENEEKKTIPNGNLKSGDVTSTTSDQPSSATASNSENSVGSSTPDTPRRKKVHPVPVVMEHSRPERRSPRKNQLKSFDCSDSDESDDEDEDAGFDMNGSDEDSEGEDGMEEEETSDEDDEDAEDDEEDDEEDEDERFLSDVQEPGYDSGCTAVVGYMKWQADGLSLWVANAGDSRCVVCREGTAVDMSHDHKPESETETKRIVKAGGKVTEDGRVNGGLNLSRAIGDHSYKQNSELPPEEQMISPLPTVEHIVLNPSKDKFVVLACDGIWNSMTSQEVVDFVGQRLDNNETLSKICEELFDACLAPDTCGDGTGCDNMTAIIVHLSDVPQAFSGFKRRRSGEEKVEESLENSESTSTKKLRVE